MFKKITTKIFAIMLIIVVLILSIQVLFQTFFLESFYIKKEIDRIEINISELADEVSGLDYNDRNNSSVLRDYISNYNDTIVIDNIRLENNDFVNFEGDTNTEFGLIVKSNKGELYSVSLTGFEIESSNLIIEGDNVIIEGKLITGDDNYLVAESVDILDQDNNILETLSADLEKYELEYPEDTINEFSDEAVDVKVSGVVVYNNMFNLFEQINYDNESRLYKAAEELYANNQTAFEYENPLDIYDVGVSDYNISEDASGKYILFAQKLAYKSGETGIVYSFTELKQIEGTIEVFNSYMWVTIGVSILISFVGSLILSRYLSRPIIEINKIASKISNLDFSEEVKYKSNDEIGNLGESLNIMANQLEGKIDELEGMNSELSTRLEYKTRQEEIRKEFVANVSHELKTPITVMKGFIEGIRDGVYKNEMHDDAMITIYKETKTMEDLIIKMLSLSKLESQESGEVEAKNELFDISSEIMMVLYRYKPLITNKNIDVICDLDESLVLGDNEKIQMVLDNLVSNAVKYTRENGIVKVDLADIGDKFMVSIYNDATIPENLDLEELWKPFVKADKSGNKAISGTGLGLAIVRKTLDIHSSDYKIELIDDGIMISFTLVKGKEELI